jgi:predicted ATPase/DNA-binding CsgD family transcriptional regulator
MGHVQASATSRAQPPGQVTLSGQEFPHGQAHSRGAQLPAEVTSFVGREAEFAQLAALLDTARLVTVTGPGGVGKTRLALRVAAKVAARYPDGVCLVDLSPVSGSRLVSALSAALGGPAGTGDDQELDVILGYLRDRRQLLILDTCEHVIESCATLAGIVLARAPGVAVLATSRQPLDMPGEYVLGLRPLPVPASGKAGSDCGDAVDLFVRRVASVVPGFTLTSGNLASVTEVCRMLDGIPLAIELAALRLRALPVRELEQLAGYRDGLTRLMTGVRRTTVPRHQTLRQLISWSHDLCTPAERAAWARLSVFGASFDLATAETVCADADLPAGQVIKAIIGLVDKSVLLREPSRGDARPDPARPDPARPDPARPDPARPDPAGLGPASEPASRYRLPHAVREEGAGHLDGAHREAGTAVRARYVAHWTRVAEYFADHVLDDQVRQYRTVHRELLNLRAAYRYALASPESGQPADGPSAARLAIALSMYWVISGDLREGKRWLDEAADGCQRPSAVLARTLAARAFLTAIAGDLPAALADAEASIAIAAAAADPVGRARGYLALHRAAAWSGDLARAAQTAALAVPALEEAGDVLGLVHVDLQSATAWLPADPAACAEACERGLRRLPPGELWAAGHLIRLTALRHFRHGNHEAASDETRRALTMNHQLGDAIGIADDLEVLACLAGAQGDYERAAWLTGAAAPLWEHAGLRHAGNPLLADMHRDMARAALHTLGMDAYARLRNAGAAQPLEETIALAARPPGEPGLLLSAAGGPAAPSAAGPPLGQQGQPGQPRQLHVGPLTGREVQIAALVANGMSNREIAEHMVISKRTVDAHVDHIFSKLGISSRVQLTTWLRDRLPQARAGQGEAGRAP